LTFGSTWQPASYGSVVSTDADTFTARRRCSSDSDFSVSPLHTTAAAAPSQLAEHRGHHYRIDDVTFLPRPQQPSIPMRVAGFPGNAKPLRRAGRYDGFFPVNLEHPDQLAEAVESVTAQRVDVTTPYDVVISLPPWADIAPYPAAGATWWATDFDRPHSLTVDTVLGVTRDGPVPYRA
jgi:hypothetical protein